LLFFWLWRSRIAFAKEMLRAVVDVSNEFPATTATAFMSLLLLLAWYVAWVATLFFVQSFKPAVAYALSLYLVFSFYWVAQVIKNVTHVTVSGLYASVYFLRGNGLPFPDTPTLDSFRRASTTSLGSICLGSLLVALLEFARTMIRLMRGNGSNWVAIIADCLLGCIESLLRWFNKYAFAQVAIYGKTFCQAASATWELIQTHGIEALVNDNIISFVLSAGCLAGGAIAAALSGGIAYVVVHDYWLLCGVLGFIIGFTMFLMPAEVIESGTATYFVCFAQDPQVLRTTNPELYQRLVTTYNLNWV